MAIDTSNKKLAVMEWCNIWEPALPLSPGGAFTQGHKQQLIWGYPGILWAVVVLFATPPGRVYEPAFEDRIYEPAFEDRTYEVPA